MTIKTKDEYIESAKKQGGVQTSCESCAFFSYPNKDEEADLDKCCSVGRLKQFQETGSEITWVHADKEGEISPIIPHRICNMMRNQSWKDFKTESHGEAAIKDIARKEAQIRCNMFIFVEHDKEISGFSGDAFEEEYFNNPSKHEEFHEIETMVRKKSKAKISKIADTMKSAVEANIQPTNITLINTCIKPYDFINYLRIELESMDVSCKWNMEYTDIADYDYTESQQALFYACAKKLDSQYFCAFCEGDDIPKDYLSDIDSMINDDLEKVLFIYNEEDEIRGMMIQGTFYKRGMTFDKNIILENEECRNLSKPLNKKIPQLP